MRVLFFLLLVLLSFPGSLSAEVASSPEQIKPLANGSEAAAATIWNTDGTEESLAKILSTKPTVLIFYRGSW